MGNPNRRSDLQNSETLLSNGIWWNMSLERFRDDMCESLVCDFPLWKFYYAAARCRGVETVRRLHFFFNLIADSNSRTPKTPESMFSTQKKIHTWRTDYSLYWKRGSYAEQSKLVRPSVRPTVRPSDRPFVRPTVRPTLRYKSFLYYSSSLCRKNWPRGFHRWGIRIWSQISIN